MMGLSWSIEVEAKCHYRKSSILDTVSNIKKSLRENGCALTHGFGCCPSWRLEWLLATGVKLLVYNWTDPEAETGQETQQSATPNTCPTETHILQQGPSTGCASCWALSVKIHVPLGENSPPTVAGVLEDRPKAMPGPGEVHKVGISVQESGGMQ